MDIFKKIINRLKKDVQEEDNRPRWKCKDGRELTIDEMSTSHIKNSLKMLKRNGFISPSTLDFYLTCPGPQGDMAQMAFEQELDQIFNAPVSSFVSLFEEELERRKGKEWIS